MNETSDCPANHTSGHRDRLRSRLELEPMSVADYEILELLLGYAIKRKDTKPLAKALIERFGNLRGCFDATREELLQLNGFGPALASLWLVFREVLARYSASSLMQRLEMASPEAVAGMANGRLSNLSHEESWVALVNTQNLLIAWERIGRGNLNFISLQPGEILQMALLRKASGIILVHNHPGGNPIPSQSDIKLTDELYDLAPKLGLRMLDHIIISSGLYYSFHKGQLFSFSGDINGRQ